MTAKGGWVEEKWRERGNSGAEKFYDVMDQSGELTDSMAALASCPIGNVLVPLSNGPIDRWLAVVQWKRRRVVEGLGVESADLKYARV